MSRGADDYDAYFKCLLVGDSATGKSCLLHRVLHNSFTGDSGTTIGVDIGTLTLNIEGKVIKAQVWDTAGQERYRAVTPAYYKGAHGALLVYDVTRRETFQNVGKWLKELRDHAPKAIVLVCGNKTDMAHLRVVAPEEGQALCQREGLYFIETSAKTADNVLQAFTTLLHHLYKSSVRTFAPGEEGEEQVTVNTENTIRIAYDEAPKKKAMCAGLQ